MGFRGSRWVAAKSEDLWSRALHTTTTTTTTNTSAFNDFIKCTSRHIGDKTLNSTSFVGVVIFIRQNYTCHQYAAAGKYCTFVFRCWMVPIGMRHHGKEFFLTSKAMIQIYIFMSQIDTIWKKKKSYFNAIHVFWIWIILQFGLQIAWWSHQVERENNFLPGLTGVERHNLIA